MLTKDLLFELGTEEIPARFLPATVSQMKKLAEEILAEKRLPYESLRVFATPRRLALLVYSMAEMQEDAVTEAKGPALSVAYDAEGAPTKALLGFCRGQGIDVSDISTKEIGNTTYIYANKTEKGQPAVDVLAGVFDTLVGKLSFPKPMRWGDEALRFVRPIRWIVALFGSAIIPYELARVKSGNISRGHRVLGSSNVVIENPSEYEEKLLRNYVIADQEKRCEKISAQIKEATAKTGGIVKEDAGLLEEVVYILEYPTVLTGKFEEKYLSLPQELVITPMREYQRYFPVYGTGGELLNKFIVVRNGDEYGSDMVVSGNENVLRSRLADAEFFWQEDCKIPLEDNHSRLKAIVFHEKLGTVAKKVERVQKLSGILAGKFGYNEEQSNKAQRAALLAKCDLVSRAVYEFPELQGIMGEYYARKGGENAEVCSAVREHYLPRFAGDALPETFTGAVLSISDKLDSIVGFFASDMIPTGSQDPYALRRAAIGITQIILHNKFHFSLADLIKAAYNLYEGVAFVKGCDATVEETVLFFRQRLENIMAEQGIRYDVINAVLAVDFDDISDAMDRARAITEARKEDDFAGVLTGFTRAANLLKNAHANSQIMVELSVDENLLKDASERRLYTEIGRVRIESNNYLEHGDYRGALLSIASLRRPADKFFEAVMVMAEEIDLRLNRLALLQEIISLSSGIGDLSQLVD